MTKDETLKMALGVTHCQCEACKNGNIHDSDCSVHNGDALPVGPCDCSLAAPPLLVQEPVAWLYPEGFAALQNGKCWTAYPTKHEDCNIPLYTASPQRPWVGLTEEDYAALGLAVAANKHQCRAIEAKLKAKNHG